MMATAVSIARLTTSAATDTDNLGTAADRFAWAKSPSILNQ